MNSEALKLKLIYKILSFDDVNELKKIDEFISKPDNSQTQLNDLIKPAKEKLDIEAVKQEQNYQPIIAEDFFKELEDLKIKEPLEDLLKIY